MFILSLYSFIAKLVNNWIIQIFYTKKRGRIGGCDLFCGYFIILSQVIISRNSWGVHIGTFPLGKSRLFRVII